VVFTTSILHNAGRGGFSRKQYLMGKLKKVSRRQQEARRKFLRTLVMGFGVVGASLLGYLPVAGRWRERIRPPGALDEHDFLASCIKCGQCVQVCPVEAIHLAGIRRFRPILLTTLTTFGGLSPMIFETSRQAKFMIPMAISLGYGIVFSTMITLILVPSLYMMLDDVKMLTRGAARMLRSGD